MAAWSLVRTEVREYLVVFLDYRTFLAVGGILLLPALWTPFMPGATGCTVLRLCSSGSTPWGVFTSVFVYDGWQNAAVLFMLAIAYLPFSSHQVPKERQSRSKFIATAVFPVAILANGFWTALKPLSVSYGQSGVVYAAWGALMAFCVIDAYPRGTVKGAWIPRYSSKEEKSAAVANLAIVVLTVGTIILNPRIFLGESQGVNGFVHTVAFLGGYLSAYAWHRQARTFARGPTSPRLNMVGKRSIVLRR